MSEQRTNKVELYKIQYLIPDEDWDYSAFADGVYDKEEADSQYFVVTRRLGFKYRAVPYKE